MWLNVIILRILEFHEKALDIRLQRLDKNDVKIGNSYNSLGQVYDKQGYYPQALVYCGKSLKIRLEKLGEEHPDVATTYNNMAVVYMNQGDYPQALEHGGIYPRRKAKQELI